MSSSNGAARWLAAAAAVLLAGGMAGPVSYDSLVGLVRRVEAE